MHEGAPPRCKCPSTTTRPLLVTFTAGAILGSLLGGYAGRRASPAVLKRGFATLLFVVAAYMLVSAIVHR